MNFEIDQRERYRVLYKDHFEKVRETICYIIYENDYFIMTVEILYENMNMPRTKGSVTPRVFSKGAIEHIERFVEDEQ